MRKLYSPTFGLLEKVTPIRLGGTSSKTPQEAAQTLGILTQDKLGVPNGVATLVNGLIPQEQLPDTIKPTVNVSGYKDIGVNIPMSFQITNFDTQSSYSVTSDNNLTVVLGPNGALTLTALAEGNLSFSINDSEYQVTGVPIRPIAPIVIAPVDGALNQIASVSFVTGAFSLLGNDPSLDTHQSTIWQLATDSLFVNKTHTSSNNSDNLTNWKVSGLTENTTYYLRVAHVGAITGQGPWSNTVSFKTKGSFVPSQLQQEVFGPTVTGEEYFAWSIDMTSDGNIMLVGAYNSNYASGNVYEFQRVNNVWAQTQSLPLDVFTEFFGYSVAVSGDGLTAVVGSPNSDAAHCYAKISGNWLYRQQLTGQDTSMGDKFGLSVTVSGDGKTLAVGARGHNNGQGAVYVYLRSNDVWTFQAKLVPTDIADNNYFGACVALSYNGNTLAVGAYGKSLSTGAVLIWTRTDGVWGGQQEFSSNDPVSGSLFGYSVALSSNGSVCVVGAPGKNSMVGAGYVYVYSNGVWTQKQKLVRTTSGTAEIDKARFGSSVSVSDDGEVVVVGAEQKSSFTGAAYVFSKTGTNWVQKHKLSAANPKTQDWFGSSVTISGDGSTCVVGAWLKEGTSVDQGSAYVFV